MVKYRLDFILDMQGFSAQELKDSVVEFTEDLQIIAPPQDKAANREFNIRALTEEPGLVFDACAQFGRLKAVKVQEEGGGDD